MKSLIKLLSNPLKIYFMWIVMIIIFCVIGIPILSQGAPGGEQKPFTLLASAIQLGVYGLLLISVFTSLKSDWFNKYWYVNVPVFLITGYLIIQTV